MYAIDGRQNVDFIEFLLRLGADVNAKGAHGTVLQHACRIGGRAVVDALLRAPAIKVDDFALHTAFGFGLDVRTCEALCAAGGDLTSTRCRAHGWLPVHYLVDSVARDSARQPGRVDAMLASRMKLMEFALDAHEKEGDEEVRCSSGQTLLMLACAHSNASMTRMILRRAHDPAKLVALTDSRGRTAYHWACHRNAKEALEVLKEFNLIEGVRDVVDADAMTGAALLAASVDTPRKHRSWPDPIERSDVLDTHVTDADIASAVGAAAALCTRHFDLAELPRTPRTCAGCFRLTTSPKRCARCKSEIYCSSTCQRLSWPAHRALCVDANPTLRETLRSTPPVEPP
jgi:ankyrin repeat protein